MKRTFVRFMSLVLCGCMLAVTFLGCSGEPKPEEGVEGKATPVAYSPEGKFTTTVTVDTATFDEDISVDDIEVAYHIINEKTKESDQDSIKVNATVDSVKRKDEKTLEVTFTDKKIAENLPSCYAVMVNKKKTGLKKMAGGVVNVGYYDNTLTPSVSSVSVFDHDLRLTLEAKEGGFVDGVTKEQITLGGCLAGMKIESLSSSGKNLTMQLTGNMVKDEGVNFYQSGKVTVAKAAFVDGHRDYFVTLPVDTTSFGLELSQITLIDGIFTVPLVGNGYEFKENITAADFTVDGVEVVGFTRKDSGLGELSLKIADVTDKNGACKALDGKTVTVKAGALDAKEDVTFELDTGDADFYPVFDFAEEKNGNYTLKLILYVHFGQFADTLSKDSVVLGNDFEAGQIVSVKRETATTAEVVITLPSGGKSVEDMDLNGKLTLKGNTLLNRWGDKKAEDTFFQRNYTLESMGKFLFDGDLELIEGVVSKLAPSTLESVFNTVGGIASAGSFVISVLELTGVIESAASKLDKVYTAIEGINNQLQNIETAMTEAEGKAIALRVADFYHDKLLQLENYRMIIVALVGDAKAKLAEEKIVEPDKKTDYDAWEKYMQKVMEKAVEMDKIDAFANLQRYYNLVQSRIVSGEGFSNIMDEYDQYMGYYYNFDVETRNDRNKFRTMLNFEMAQTSTLLCSFYRYGSSSPSNQLIKRISDQYEEVKKAIGDKKIAERTDHKAYFYLNGLTYSCVFWSNAVHIGYPALNDAQAKSFIRRLHGKTVLDVFKEAQLTTCWKDHPEYAYAGSSFEEASTSNAGNGYCYTNDYVSKGDGFFTKMKVTYTSKVIVENKANPEIKTGIVNCYLTWGFFWDFKESTKVFELSLG